MNANGWLAMAFGLVAGIGLCTASVVVVSVWVYLRSERAPE